MDPVAGGVRDVDLHLVPCALEAQVEMAEIERLADAEVAHGERCRPRRPTRQAGSGKVRRMETSAPPRNAVLAVVCAALLWSSGGLFIKIAPFGPLGVACGRALVTTLFYLLVLRPNLR